jgi:hypothetical protein
MQLLWLTSLDSRRAAASGTTASNPVWQRICLKFPQPDIDIEFFVIFVLES